MKRFLMLFLCMVLCMAGSGCRSDEADGETSRPAGRNVLTVLNYGEYIDRSVLKDFEKETGIRVLYEEATTPEEMYAKYMSGAIDYDLICTSEYMVRRFIDEKQVQPIDWNNVPNRKNIGERYWKLISTFDPKCEYTMPYFWGTVGILYDSERVHGPVDSWEVLFNGEYSGEIIMQNSIRDAYMCALKYKGYSLNTTDPQEMAEAQELLLRQKPDVEAYFVDEVREEMLAGNAILAVCYSGEAAMARDRNEKLEYVLPKEGSNLWQDCWILMKRSRNKEGAEKFLDFLCRVDIARKNFEEVYYPTPNEALYEELPEDEKEDECIFPPEELVEKCEVYQALDKETIARYSRMWKELKVQ